MFINDTNVMVMMLLLLFEKFNITWFILEVTYHTESHKLKFSLQRRRANVLLTLLSPLALFAAQILPLSASDN